MKLSDLTKKKEWDKLFLTISWDELQSLKNEILHQEYLQGKLKGFEFLLRLETYAQSRFDQKNVQLGQSSPTLTSSLTPLEKVELDLKEAMMDESKKFSEKSHETKDQPK